MENPKVVFDSSNIIYIFAKSVSVTASVVNHLVKWGDTGIIAVPICGGTVRLVSK